jgi:hypothetical protein
MPQSLRAASFTNILIESTIMTEADLVFKQMQALLETLSLQIQLNKSVRLIAECFYNFARSEDHMYRLADAVHLSLYAITKTWYADGEHFPNDSSASRTIAEDAE